MPAAPTVVLVHGAFAESASWSGVIARLTERGVAAVATPNPLRSVRTDAANVRSAVEGIGGPVLLVGHSYGGAVITEAAVDSTAVVGLVYVAAFAPDQGENALQLTGQFPGSTLGDTVRPYPLDDGSHDLLVDRDLFPNQFAADVAPAEAAIQARTQRPVRDVALGEAQPSVPAWKSLPAGSTAPSPNCPTAGTSRSPCFRCTKCDSAFGNSPETGRISRIRTPEGAEKRAGMGTAESQGTPGKIQGTYRAL